MSLPVVLRIQRNQGFRFYNTGRGFAVCDTTINRHNVLKTIKGGEVTGRTVKDCADSVVGRLGVHQTCWRKVMSIIEDLIRADEVELRDAQLRFIDLTVEEREKRDLEALKKLKRRKAAKARQAEHRSGGVRNWPVVVIAIDDNQPPEEEGFIPKEWDGVNPDDLVSPPIHPAGGWDEVLAEYQRLVDAQFKDWAGLDEEDPLVSTYGLPDGVDAIMNSRYAVTHGYVTQHGCYVA